jgi:hypothetical protein
MTQMAVTGEDGLCWSYFWQVGIFVVMDGQQAPTGWQHRQVHNNLPLTPRRLISHQ